MNPVFADTFYWIALTNVRDETHSQALTFASSTSIGMVVTTQEVLVEYLNYFAEWGPRFRQVAARNVESYAHNGAMRVIHQSVDSFQAGLTLYLRRPDKGYSLTDCISMITMRREGITDVLTNDAHFEQEGFRALFRVSE
jgi:predicted nucleic acid-binding protein